MLVLGGSQIHRGGLEAFCERSAAAISRHAESWEAVWWPTNTAYLSPRRVGTVISAWKRGSQIELHGLDLVWLQWSTLADLIFLRRVVAAGLPVMVTPHLGANARLQRIPALRSLCTRLLARADRLNLLFPEQDREVALPPGVPRTLIGTFLPEAALSMPAVADPQGPLRLIHAGRLGYGKGTFRMVALCVALRAHGVPFKAQIVGRAEPSIKVELANAIAAAKLGDALTVIDWMDEHALVAALRQADVLVHLSELDSFPLIVLEALAAGTTPVVADMAGARAMVEHYHGLVATGADAGVATAAGWLAAQDLTELRRHAAQVAERVRHEQAWESGVARIVGAAEATLADRVKSAPS